MPRGLADYSAYLFDVDGTLLFPDGVVPGAAQALRSLKARGRAVLAVTNNSSLRRHALAERFRQAGLPLEDREVFSALLATAQLVAQERPGASVHVFGNPGLRDECAARGLAPTAAETAEYLVVGNNAGLDYGQVAAAMRTLLNGARFVAVNNDRAYVGAEGRLVPGVGAWVAALERASGRGVDVVVGKPSATILREAAESVGCPPSACLYVGDNAEVDVHGAHAAGMDALLVLTGVSRAAHHGEQPEHVLPSVADLPRSFGD